MIRDKQLTSWEFIKIIDMAITVFPGMCVSEAAAHLLCVKVGTVIDLYTAGELPEAQLRLVKMLLGPNGRFIAMMRAAAIRQKLKKDKSR